jgi:hypothetical protein
MALTNIRAYIDYLPLDPLSNFFETDGERIVRAFFFTSDLGRLAARLIEGVASLQSTNSTRIITGSRGTGKSHLASVVRTLASIPKTRNLVISNPQVANAVKRLEGNTFLPVLIDGRAILEGTTDFIGALRHALRNIPGNQIEIDDAQWFQAVEAGNIFELLASKLFPGMAYLFCVDDLSAIFRSQSRDIIQHTLTWLAFLAAKAKSFPISALVVLDEDVMDPQTGQAARLAADFQIDTLTADNLRRISDQAVFKKNPTQRTELSKLYQEALKSLPRFHWSEEEFSDLYPLHPAVLEVAPGLSAYCDSFTLFGFINAAVGRALGPRRHPLQLISLDELFDQYDFEFKRNPLLERALAVYDYLATMRVPALPSDQRIPAKLILKGLFLYSLVNKPVSADELTNALMLYDNGYQQVSALLDDLFTHSEGQIVKQGNGGACRYSITVIERFDPDSRLRHVLEDVSDNDPHLEALLITLGGGHFIDFPFTLDTLLLGGATSLRLETTALWRNTLRRGVVGFNSPIEVTPIPPVQIERSGETFTPSGIIIPMRDADDLKPSIIYHWADECCEFDWQLLMLSAVNPVIPENTPTVPSLLFWQPEKLTLEDRGKLKSLWVAYTHGEEVFGIELTERRQMLEAEVREIFKRCYLENGVLVSVNGEKQPLKRFTSEHTSKHFWDFLSSAIQKPLDIRFPAHPVFKEVLTEREVKRLVLGLLGGLNPNEPTVQEHAANYAVPFQMVVRRDEQYQLAMDRDEALSQPCISEVLRLVEANAHDAVPVQVVYQTLRREPYGLLEPAQQLIIMALVAGWRIELIDVSGLRVFSAAELTQDVSFRQYGTMRRTATITYSSEVLSEWCRLLTERPDLPDLTTGRKQVRESLAKWHRTWLEYDLAARFNELPMEMLTTRTWQLIITCKRYFETTAGAIEAVLYERISIEMGLARVVDIFAANPTIYQRAVLDLRILVEFLDWLSIYVWAKSYTMSALPVKHPEAVSARRELTNFFEHPHRLLDEDKRSRFEQVFKTFHRHYMEEHLERQKAFKETDPKPLQAFLASPSWRLFETLTQLAISNGRHLQLARELVGRMHFHPTFVPLEPFLEVRPMVVDELRFAPSDSPVEILEEIKGVVRNGIDYHRKLIAGNRARILANLKTIGLSEEEERQVSVAVAALSALDPNTEVRLSAETIDRINEALALDSAVTTVHPPAPFTLGETLTKQELKSRLDAWIQSLPEEGQLTFEISDGNINEIS